MHCMIIHTFKFINTNANPMSSVQMPTSSREIQNAFFAAKWHLHPTERHHILRFSTIDCMVVHHFQLISIKLNDITEFDSSSKLLHPEDVSSNADRTSEKATTEPSQISQSIRNPLPGSYEKKIWIPSLGWSYWVVIRSKFSWRNYLSQKMLSKKDTPTYTNYPFNLRLTNE